MVPEVRALADRFIYDTATLKYMATSSPAGGLDRMAPGSGWTVRQILAHLAENQARYAATIARWLADEPGLTLPGDPHEANAAAERNAGVLIPDIIVMFDTSLCDLVDVSQRIDKERAAGLIGRWDAMRVLNAWASHAQGHAIDLVSALPELKTDAMVLNWSLHFDFSQDQASVQWQKELAREVRALFQVQGQEEE